ncbi:MAG: IclR family transcriptional regulator [Burkholderiales bacterium]|nr:IclR family transcriptional regulator [Burkholderiales bacterium]
MDSYEDPGTPHPSARGTQAIGRAAALLRALAHDNRNGLRLAQLAPKLGLERPTAYRILRRLVEEGLVRQDPASRAYHLGELVYDLGLLADSGNHLRDLCRGSVERLAIESGDTSFLIAPRGSDCICLDRAEGTYPIKVLTLDPGQRRPTGIGAGSIALLALLSPQESARVLEQNRQRLATLGENDVEALIACVERARADGYAIKQPPDVPEVLSLSIALHDAAGAPALALSIASLATRITSRLPTLVALLRDEVRSLRPLLGPAGARSVDRIDRAGPQRVTAQTPASASRKRRMTSS